MPGGVRCGTLCTSNRGNDMKKKANSKQAMEKCKYGNIQASCTSSPMDCQCALDAVFEQHGPVGYAVYHRLGGSKTFHWPEQHSPDGDANEYRLVPLYPKREWVGLTDEDIRPMCKEDWLFDTVKQWAQIIEAKLREKNT